MARLVDLGITKYVWVTGTIANAAAPTVAEVTGGSTKDISQFVVTTTSVGATGSDTTQEKGITDVANVDVPTIGNYQGTLVLFRDYSTGIPTAGTDILETFTGSGLLGYLVRRMGKSYSTALASGDKVEVYKFLTDTPQLSGGTGDGYLKVTVPLLQQGTFSVNATVAP